MTLGLEFPSIIAAARTGAEWAWEVIYKHLAGPITAYLASQGAQEPEDLTSETFLQAARDISSFKGDERGFRSWLFVIAHRRLLDSWRAAGRRPQITSDLDNVVEPRGGDTEEEAMERLAEGELLQAFARLTDDQRALLALRILGNLTLSETAVVLGRSLGAVKVLQRRAVLALKKMLDDPA